MSRPMATEFSVLCERKADENHIKLHTVAGEALIASVRPRLWRAQLLTLS